MRKFLKQITSNISPAWIAPILALVVALGLIWENSINKGPLVTLTMRSAEGIEAGKTLIKARNVKVGLVETLGLSKDLKQIVAQIRLDAGMEALLKSDSVFWVVAPRLSAGRVSGLETLLSGPYIAIRPGTSKEKRMEFELSPIEPGDDTKTQGREFVLQSDGTRNRLDPGDPITYHDVEIGQVLRINYDLTRRRTFYEVHIYGPYLDLIDSSAVFYEYGGIQLEIGTSGIDLNIDSLQQLLRGGICMERYDKLEKHRVLDEHLFKLYEDPKQASISVMKSYPAFVFFLQGGLDGLRVRSPVLLNGIPVGEVTDIAWYDDENNIFLEGPIPVRFSIHKGTTKFVRELIESKLREGKASVNITSSSILANHDTVNLTMLNEVKQSDGSISFFRDVPVIPVISSSTMMTSLEKILDKISKVDIVHLSESTDQFLANFASLAKELQTATSVAVKTRTIERFNAALDAFSETLGTMQGKGDSGNQLKLLIEDLRLTLQALMPIVQDLQQKTNSLVFSDGTPDPVPQPKQ